MEAAAKSLEQVTDEVRRVLNDITDPCSIAAGVPAGMMDMGLVREATVETISPQRYTARVRISVTHPFCLMAGVFLNEVEKRLRCLPQIESVEASIDSSTMWRPEMMTVEYREKLATKRRGRLSETVKVGESS